MPIKYALRVQSSSSDFSLDFHGCNENLSGDLSYIMTLTSYEISFLQSFGITISRSRFREHIL